MTTVKETLKWIYERPARALKVYYGGGRKDAITEMCIGCVGSTQEAAKCQCQDCPLWTFRPGASKGLYNEATEAFEPCDIPSFIPPREQLEQLAAANVSDAVRSNAQKMGNARKAQKELDTDEE